MRKITRLLAIIMALVTTQNAFGRQGIVKNYSVNENFDTGTTAPWGFVAGNNTTISLSSQTGYSNVLSFSVSGATGSRTSTKTFASPIVPPTDNILKVSFDLYMGTTSNDGIYLRLNDGTNVSLALAYENSTTNALHLCNLTPASITLRDATTAVVPTTGSFPKGSWVNVYAVLNYSTHYIDSIKFTSSTTSYVNTHIAFMSALSANISKLDFATSRASGVTFASTTYLDNFQIYNMVTSDIGNVTVNYLDPSGNPFKTARVIADQIVGTTYTALPSDKITYTDGTYYYVYDVANTTSDNVIATVDDLAAINLKFTKVAAVSGTYIWTGTTSANWNESDANFTTDGSNSLAYQNTNAISFPATAIQKTVNLTRALNMGTQSINLAGDGYTLQGTGSITGSKSALNLNLTSGQTATLNFINNLDSVVVNGGKAVISSDASGKKYCLADGAKLTLQTGVAFAKPVTGTGSITIETISNVNYNNTLTGASTINYILGSAGSLSSSTWSNGVNTVMPACTLNVSTTTGVASGFGVSDASLTNAKVSLGDNIRLLKSYNQSSGVGSTISVGELSGSASSTLEGGFVAARILNYNIGGLNTDATFAGTILNYIQIASPTAVNTDILNIYKKGTGIWTLTGTSPLFTVGSFNVDAGRVIMNGSLGSTAVPVTVAANGTLSGTGTFAGATTVNGILEGPLNFGSTLTLAGTTNITGTGFDAGQFDVVNVIGAVTNGGTLNITIAAAEPTASVSIKVINAATYVGTFTAVNVSPAATSASGWGYNHSTGVLTYYPLGTGINAEFSNVNIYPTLTRGDVHVNADNVSSIDVVSLTGQLVKQVKTTATTSIINLNGLSTGAYFVKVRFADGSVKAQRILLQK